MPIGYHNVMLSFVVRASNDALAAARTALAASDELDPNRAVYIFGSGASSTGAAPGAVLADDQLADIRIFTLDYGVIAGDAALLHLLADSTDGRYAPVSLGLPALIGGINRADNLLALAATVDLIHDSAPVSSTLPLEQAVFVDAGLGMIGAEVIFRGNAGDVGAALRDPAAAETPVSDCTTAADADGPLTICMVEINAPTTGTWTLSAQTAISTPLYYRVFGRPPADASTLYPVVSLPQEYALVYPMPVLVTAHVFKDAFVTGIEVAGTLQAPHDSLRHGRFGRGMEPRRHVARGRAGHHLASAGDPRRAGHHRGRT